MSVVKLHCHVGRCSKTFNVPGPFRGQPTFIEEAFRRGSNGVIDMEVINHTSGDALVADNAKLVDALDLHRSALALTRNVPGQRPVDRIALIIADRYAPRHGVFGVMFDEGFPTDDDPVRSNRYLATPREACAIFVGAIESRRSDEREIDREVGFTAVHELGHIFNLGHVDARIPSFMATSQPNKSYPNRWFSFDDNQQNWLSECDTNLRVMPGGTEFEPVYGFNDVSNSFAKSINSQLVLEIGLPLTVLPSLYPIELDVKLRIATPTIKRMYVPDRIDPGYDDFKIWLTLPNGERKLFRSLRTYCAPNKRVAVTQKKPFHRDISLFSNVNGSIFTGPGLYQIQAEFQIGKRGRLLSNTVTVEVAANSKFLSDYETEMLTNTRVRKFIYHRNLKCGRDIVSQLSEYLDNNEKANMLSASVRYSILRALVSGEMKIGLPSFGHLEFPNISIPRLLESLHNSETFLSRRQAFHLERITSNYA